MKGKEIVFVKPWSTELRGMEFDRSSIGDEGVAIETEASVVSAGTELAILSGGESWAPLPYVPGYGAVGKIAATGKNVKGMKEGDRIFSYSKHASHAAASTMCVRVPDNVSSAEAAMARIALVSITSLRVSEAQLGDFVVVYGAGLVGNLAAQLFTTAGCEVIAIDVSEKRLETARKCGVKHVLKADGDLKARVAEITGGEMCRTGVEATGVPVVIPKTFDLAAPLGEVILLGSPRGEYQTDLTAFLNRVHLWGNPGCVTLKGAHEWRFPTEKGGHPYTRHTLTRNAEVIMRMISDGRLRVRELISHLLPPSKCQEAYMGLRNEKDVYTGVVFDWSK